MKRLCLTLAAALAALTLTPSAHALSCMPPDIQQELTEAIESDKVYHIFVGYFNGPQVLHKNIQDDDPFIISDRTQIVSGFFTGVSLAKHRRDDVSLENFPVQIKASCAAHWCGQVPRGNQKMIAFVEAQVDAPPLLTMGACPYMSHSYSEDKVETLRRGL